MGRCFLNGDKIEILKIILSPCLVNISDGDKIPIDMFSEMGTWLSLCSLNNYMKTWSFYFFVLFERIMSLFLVVILTLILSPGCFIYTPCSCVYVSCWVCSDLADG